MVAGFLDYVIWDEKVPNRLLGLSTRFPTDAAVLVCDSFER